MPETFDDMQREIAGAMAEERDAEATLNEETREKMQALQGTLPDYDLGAKPISPTGQLIDAETVLRERTEAVRTLRVALEADPKLAAAFNLLAPYHNIG